MYVGYAVATFVTVFSLMLLLVEVEAPPRAAPQAQQTLGDNPAAAPNKPDAQPLAATQMRRVPGEDPGATTGKRDVRQLASTQTQPALSDDQVRDRMIAESIGKYSGPCACPYNMMRTGRPCDTRSAYSKPGGAGPLCFRRDISDTMVRNWRARLQSR